ncbi:MAG: hypothetical protein CSA20_01905 [Deltaproteobacteria bacterium]|nr:MAG: hypothetical protein CSA20_01905 [Deltaproteobacteria bacterium]
MSKRRKQYLLCLFILLLAHTVHADICDTNQKDTCTINIELHKSVVKKTKETITRVSIADPKIADYHLISPHQILLISKDEPGTTNLVIWYDGKNGGADDNIEEKIDVCEIRVFVSRKLIESLEEKLHEIVPGARVNVHTGPKILLTGEVESQEELDTVLKIVSSYVSSFTNLITVQGNQQVQLEVKIAEVSRTGAKKMGLGFLTNRNWTVGLLPSSSGASGTLTNTTTRAPGSTASSASSDQISTSFAQNSEGYWESGISVTTGGETSLGEAADITRSFINEVSLSTPFSSAFQLVVQSLNDDFMGILSVLKSQSLARIMASPTLVTMNGQEASFLAGGEYPIPVSTSDGAVTLNYKKYGVMLNFTPFVTGRETITLKVEPEISSLDYSNAVASGGAVVPGLTTRRGSTTLQLKDGQTFVMAGLLKEDLATVTDKVPLLGDIPYIGSLFTSKELQKSESELLIIVTPRLVRALNPGEVPSLPGEGEMGMASDWDFFVKNELEPGQDAKAQEKEPELTGGSGFAK